MWLTTEKKEKIREKDRERKRAKKRAMEVLQEKRRFHNRVRQSRYKYYHKLPKDEKRKGEILIANLERYVKENKEVDDCLLKRISCLASCNHREANDVNHKLNRIKTLNAQSRTKEKNILVAELRFKYTTIKRIANIAGLKRQRVHKIFKIGSQMKQHKGTIRKNKKMKEVEDFLKHESVSSTLPGKKFAKKRYLNDTIHQTYRKFLKQRKEKNEKISFTAFKNYRPKYIKLLRDTPFLQCLCNYCINTEMMKKMMHAIGLQGLGANKYRIVDQTVCETRIKQYGAHQEFPKKNCIERKCKACGPKKFTALLKENNKEMIQTNMRVRFWEWVIRNGYIPTRMQMQCTLVASLKRLEQHLQMISAHLFRADWHKNVFIRQNLI